MERVLIEPEARFRLERLCDSLWPQEVGGYLLGEVVDPDIVVKDAFPVPNVSEKSKRNYYKEHPWGDRWCKIYAKVIGLSRLESFKFHSHPDGTIPSAGDMRACPGLNLWVIHHDIGKHTFRASRDYHDREVLLLNEPREIVRPHFEGDNYNLGTIVIDSLGRLGMNPRSEVMMEVKDETRRLLLLALRSARRGRVDVDSIVKHSGRTRTTVRKHLNNLVDLGLLKKGWRRGDYEIVEEAGAK